VVVQQEGLLNILKNIKEWENNMSLYENINKRKKAGISRSKKNSTISKKNYENMKKGFPKRTGGSIKSKKESDMMMEKGKKMMGKMMKKGKKMMYGGMMKKKKRMGGAVSYSSGSTKGMSKKYPGMGE